MAWIKSDVELENHPKVIELMMLTGWDKYHTIGRLHCLWYWCLKYAESGDLSKYNRNTLGLALGYPENSNIIEHLISARFIDIEPLRVHGWTERISEYLKIKYHTSNPKKYKKIVGEYRKCLGKPIGKPKDYPKDYPKEDPDKIRLDKIRSDKIRLDKINTSKGFEEFWNLYPKKQGKQKALDAWNKLEIGDELLVVILKAVASHSQSQQWVKDNGQYIPLPATWLNQKRWEDQLEAAVSSVYKMPSNYLTDTSLKSYCCNANFTSDHKCSVCNEDYSQVNSGVKIVMKSV
jgi:hypothetical protein